MICVHYVSVRRAAFPSPHIPGGGAAPGAERPHFPVTMRLLRLVSVIVHKYHDVLVSTYTTLQLSDETHTGSYSQ